MNIWIRQIYIEAGVNFPFSHIWQGWLSDQLSSLAVPSAKFIAKYGIDFELGINLSTRRGLVENEIKGPSVYRKRKDVEYSLFLPYDVVVGAADGCRVAMELILRGIQDIFVKSNIHAEGFDAKKAFIIDHVCSDPTMLSEPWPQCDP